MPEVAAAASWCEALQLPLREIKRRYTKSDMTFMAWRSQEMAANMERRRETATTPSPPRAADTVEDTVQKSYSRRQPAPPPELVSREEAELEARLGPVAHKLDEKLDIRQLSGAETFRFLAAQGVKIPVFPRPKKPQR